MPSKFDHTMTSSTMPKVALVIRKQWCQAIFESAKIWEIRGTRTTRRGLIAVAQAGSKEIIGQVDILDCLCVGRREGDQIVPVTMGWLRCSTHELHWGKCELHQALHPRHPCDNQISQNLCLGIGQQMPLHHAKTLQSPEGLHSMDQIDSAQDCQSGTKWFISIQNPETRGLKNLEPVTTSKSIYNKLVWGKWDISIG